jgi:hypothetical protein
MSQQQVMTFFGNMASTLAMITKTPVATLRNGLGALVAADYPWDVIQGLLANQEAATKAALAISGVELPGEPERTVKPS